MMKPEDRSRMEALCAQIAVETDNRKFSELMQELISLLEASRLPAAAPSPSPPAPRKWPPKGGLRVDS